MAKISYRGGTKFSENRKSSQEITNMFYEKGGTNIAIKVVTAQLRKILDEKK